jgi:hypothetical protein
VGYSGSGAVIYQWLRNGVIITGATNAILTITNAQVADSGSYSAVVSTDKGALDSVDALLTVQAPELGFADDLRSALELTALAGTGRGSKTISTLEIDEPQHAEKNGDRSVLNAWRAPERGIATFSTIGSTFDTLLGIYTGSGFTNLMEVASDDDAGGFHTSSVRFNAVSGELYQIAVAGFGDCRGDIVLSWNLETTTASVPQLINHPSDQVVAPGTNVVFSVQATGSGLTYQWFFNNVPLPAATGTNLVITSVNETDVGYYFARVINSGRVAESRRASLQLALFDTNGPPILLPLGRGANKFFDAAERGLRP